MLAKSKLKKHGRVKGNENLKITVQQIKLSLLTLETKLKGVTYQVKEQRGLIEKHETCISELRARLILGRMNQTHSDGTKSGEESFNHESSDNDWIDIPSGEEENDSQDHPEADPLSETFADAVHEEFPQEGISSSNSESVTAVSSSAVVGSKSENSSRAENVNVETLENKKLGLTVGIQSGICDEAVGGSNLRRQLLEHSKGPSKYQCGICDNNYMYKSTFKRHFAKRHRGKTPTLSKRPFVHPLCFACSVCGMEYPNEQKLKWHSKIHQPEAKWKCTSCSIGFATSSSLNRHKKYIHDNHIGPTRKTASTKQASLDSTKFKEVRIVCERIDVEKWRADPRRFSNEQALDNSENIAPEMVTPADAPSGDNLTNLKFETDQVISVNEPEDPQPKEITDFICRTCKWAFETESELENHSLSHSSLSHSAAGQGTSKGPKKSKCSICTHEFSRTDSWRQHMRHKHPDKPLYERKYDPIFYRNEIKCPICKKTFSKVFVWNNHMRSNHPGSVAQPIFERVLSKKPYQCSVCHSHFTGQWRFKKHIMEKHPDPFAELSPQEQDIEEHQQGLNPGTHFIVSESFVNEVEISSSNS